MSFYNMLHGMNPLADLYLAMLGLTKDLVPRFRDVYLQKREDGYAIVVHTRMGGGNRGHWTFTHPDEEPGPDCTCPGCQAQHVLGKHPLHLYDEDDDFDYTTMTRLCLLAGMLRDEPLAEMLETLDRVDSIGPILHPTLYRDGLRNIDGQRRLLGALLRVQRVVLEVAPADLEASGG
jgi:hypothetical protein